MTTALKIQYVEAQLIIPMQLHHLEGLRQFLDAFEQTPLSPTHWGPARGVRDPYGRSDLEAYVTERQRQDLVPRIQHRRAPLRTDTYWHTGENGISSVHVKAIAPEAGGAAAVFETLEQLADALPTEIATADIRFIDQDRSTTMGKRSLHAVGEFGENGPSTIFPRTIFGPRLVALMGGASPLEKNGVLVRHLPNTGGLAFDLAPRPWAAPPSALKKAQLSIARHLRLAGMLSQYVDHRPTPAARWLPLPNPGAISC